MTIRRPMTMDAENLELQNRLHQANQDRMTRIESELLKVRTEQEMQSRQNAQIIANTSCLPSVIKRIDDLEATDDKHKGILWLLGLLWTGLSAGFGLMHWK
jgi:hypothetical protein